MVFEVYRKLIRRQRNLARNSVIIFIKTGSGFLNVPFFPIIFRCKKYIGKTEEKGALRKACFIANFGLKVRTKCILLRRSKAIAAAGRQNLTVFLCNIFIRISKTIV